ncbi:HpcH/HpaI aldolase/citrate lyase family protein [Nocardia sp. NPDC055321]
MTWQIPGPGWLFCPADRPERFEKAAAAADVVILDLEDGVAPDDKPAARAALLRTPLDPETTVVRIGAVATADHALDLAAIARTGYRRLLLAKAESADQCAALTGYEVIALVESPLGALAVERILWADTVIGAMWGAEDLVAGLGGQSSRRPGGGFHDVARHVRSATLLAAKACGKFALDAVFTDIGDIDGLRAETAEIAAVGFDAKPAIHPSQVAVIRAAYAPSEAELSWARDVLEQAPEHRGVFRFRGRMVDGPVLLQAERIVNRAAASA